MALCADAAYSLTYSCLLLSFSVTTYITPYLLGCQASWVDITTDMESCWLAYLRMLGFGPGGLPHGHRAPQARLAHCAG